jgi:ATP-binding cassette subfamily B protein
MCSGIRKLKGLIIMNGDMNDHSQFYKQVPDEFKEKIHALLKDGEEIKFTILGDLLLTGSYGSSLVCLTESRLIAVDPIHSSGALALDLSQIKNARVKRMYGNCLFKMEADGKTVNAARFTYAVADLFDGMAQFINNTNDGMDYDEQCEILIECYIKRKSRCSKCGRKIPRGGDTCLFCAGRKNFLTKVYGYMKPYIPMLLLSLVLSSMTTAASLIPPYLTKELVDGVLLRDDLAGLRRIVLLLLSIYAFEAVIGCARNYVLRISGNKIVTSLRDEVYAKAQRLPMKYYDKTSTGAVMNRISGDTSNLQSFMMRISQDVIIQFMTMIGIAVIMVSLNWKLSLLSLIPVPIVVIGSKIFADKMKPIYMRIWKRSSRITSILADTLPGIKVIKSFTSEDRAISAFEKSTQDLLDENMRAARITSIYPSAVSFLVMCGGLVIWGLGGYLVIKSPEQLSIGVLVAFISYTSRFYGPVQFFANLNDTFQSATTSAERIFEIIDAETEEDSGTGTIQGQEVKGKIVFKDVSFYYERGKKVLDSVNFTIQPGQTLGIVGTTGSGKSTIVNLIMRFYEDYEGQILLDGVDIKDIDLKYYRSHVGYVLQEPMLFRNTILENISYSKPEATIEEVIEAAKVANAHGFITKLPDAYDTMLGERGTGLSGGEKQRISIARAVLKNPKILILDEATASVDSETEHLIQEAIDRLVKGRTTIMIAHRLSTLKKADKIIVVENGKIIESGSHDELMALRGKFYNMVQIQSLSLEIKEKDILGTKIDADGKEVLDNGYKHYAVL